MSCERLGDDFRLLWDSDTTAVLDCDGVTTIGHGSWDKPQWTEEISIGDLGFDFAIEQVEIPLRIPVKTYQPGRADWTMSFSANYNLSGDFPEAPSPASHFFDRLIEMVGSGGVIHLALSDGPLAYQTPGDTSTATLFNCWHAWWTVTGNLSAALDTNATLDVECRAHTYRGDSGTELPELRANGYTEPVGP